jgi:hypothetical protein
VAKMGGANCVLHPLIHTFASGASAQNSGVETSESGLNISCQDVNFREIKDMKRRSKHFGGIPDLT